MNLYRTKRKALEIRAKILGVKYPHRLTVAELRKSISRKLYDEDKRRMPEDEFLRVVRAAVVIGDKRQVHIKTYAHLLKIIDRLCQ